jgi:hypothetical protein
MGYDLHLARASDWTDSEGDPIPENDWAEFADASLHVSADISADGGPTVYQLRAHPEAPTLQWDRGQVTVWGATEGDVAELLRVAGQVGAQLVGDDGESYPLSKKSLWRRRR